MSEPQLERSVLESKEREELFAIATALGTGPSSRARKSDLVNQILQATGVEVAEAKEVPEKPRRTRARKAAADPESAPAKAAPADAAQPELDLEATPTKTPAKAATKAAGGRTRRGAAPEPATVEGAAPEATAAEATPEPKDTAEPETTPTATPSPAEPVAAEPMSVPPVTSRPSESPARSPEPTPARVAETRPAEPVTARPGEPATSGLAAARSSIGGRPVAGTPPRPTNGAGGPRPGQGGGRIPPRPDVNGGAGNGASSGSGSGNSSANNGTPSGGGPRRNPSSSSERAAGPGNSNGSNEGGPDSGGESGAPGARLEAETGNRRSRRRRGRDRGADRAERDLVGQAPEQPFAGEPAAVSGYLDLRDEGYGFLRSNGYLSGPDDVYVSVSQARRFALRRGDQIEGGARPAGGNEKYPALIRVDKVSGLDGDEARERPRFEALTPLFPDQRLRLEHAGDAGNLTARIIDLIAPIGKGQRGMIVSPPKAGKTTILKQVAHSIEANNPDVHLIVLLIDERPEEVTDMRRSVSGEVVASTFDRPADEHIQIAELVIERAKRMVELGRDVVIVLDGITRLSRAYNLAQPASGRVMSGGIDTGALYPPKKFFGAARNIEEGGSLTILATALVETGSRMDEVIFEEFKGTGNMELRLDRRMAERRIYPAIDVNGSSTRHEELLFDKAQLQQVWKLRRVLNALSNEGNQGAGLELLIDRMKATRSNDEFLAELAKNPVPGV
jgi:transcription termination factor Rho